MFLEATFQVPAYICSTLIFSFRCLWQIIANGSMLAQVEWQLWLLTIYGIHYHDDMSITQRSPRISQLIDDVGVRGQAFCALIDDRDVSDKYLRMPDLL